MDPQDPQDDDAMDSQNPQGDDATDQQNPQADDALDSTPEKIIRNTNGNTTACDRYVKEYIRAGARLVAKLADPDLSTEEVVTMILNSGLLSINKILCEAAKVDPELHSKGRLEYRWKPMQNYFADLLSYVLRDEEWSHHLREAAEALISLTKDRKYGKNDMSAAEVIRHVCAIDQARYRDSPGYLLHLLLAVAARPDGKVAEAVCGMYKRIFLRWTAASRAALGTFDVKLRPDISQERFARALAVVADGVALQTTSTAGQLDPAGERDVSLLADIVMILLVGAVDVNKSGVSLTDAVNALIKPGDAATSMGDVVVWQATDVPGQTVGQVGSTELFIISHDDSGGFTLGSRDLWGIDSGVVEFAPDPFSSAEEAQQAAEERTVRMLRALDLVPRRTA
jgi:hypothetical protein